MPSVLLLHGVQSNRDAWWRMLRDLPDLGIAVQAIDMLGHGGRTDGPSGRWTLRDFAADVADRVEPVDLVVGHSLGAIVALAAAAVRPELARAVLAEDPPDGNDDQIEQVAEGVVEATAAARADAGAAEAGILAENPTWATFDARHSVAARRSLAVEPVVDFLHGPRWDLAGLVRDCPVPVHLLAAEGPGTALGEPVRGELFALLGSRATAVSSGHSVYRDRPGIWLDVVSRLLAALER